MYMILYNYNYNNTDTFMTKLRLLIKYDGRDTKTG